MLGILKKSATVSKILSKNRMKTILTHQSAQYQGEDVLVIDGEKSIYSGTSAQVEAQKLIRKLYNPQFEEKIPGIFKCTGTSRSLKIFISDSGELVVSSNFQSNDDKGRNISYDFYCDNIDNSARVIRVLADDSRIAGMKPNPADIKTLNKFLTFYKNRARNCVLAGAGALVFLWVLIKIIF